MTEKLIWTEEELPQGSDEWLRFRGATGEFAPRGGFQHTLGGSEIACLMYATCWKSMGMLWEEKLGMRQKGDFTEVMQRGNHFEPLARKIYSDSFGVEVEQLCAVHPDYPWMRTSLDGITKDKRVVLEIKTPKNRANHEKQTKNGKVVAHRYPQMQWQLAVMMAHFPSVERVDYVSFLIEEKDEDGNDIENPNMEMKIIKVYPDMDYIREIIRRAEIFIGYLDRRERPPVNLFRETEPLVVRRLQPALPTN